MSVEYLKSTIKDTDSAYLIMSEENIRYLTSFSSTNGYLLITKNISIFLTDSRYIEKAQKTIVSCDEVAEIKTISKTLVPLIENLKIKKLYFEISRLTVASFNNFHNLFPQLKLVNNNDLDNIINSMRMVKIEKEVVAVKKAQSIAEKAFDHILSFISKEKTEKEIALELEYFMLRNGADGLSFETIAVSGKNSSMPHGVPTDKKINDGDFITMDYGAVVDGYHSDMTRTVALGNVSEKMAEVYNIVLQAQNAAFPEIRPGVLCKTVDEKARNVIKLNGYGEYFGHSLGHGVGIEIHELPNLSPSSEMKLEAGNIVTVEPGIYIPDEFGVRIEDMALVTETGYENLTSCKKELIVL